MAEQPDSPSPSSNPLVRCFPVMKATLHFSLPRSQVRGRLLGPNEEEWRTGGSGIFANSRRYAVRPRPNGYVLAIDGPYGYRKTRLATQASLIASEQGTTLELESRITPMQAGFTLLVTLWLPLVALVIGGPLPIVVGAFLLGLFMIYGVTLFNLNYEAGVIKDYCIGRINDTSPRVFV
jgi:hypothetical protein